MYLGKHRMSTTRTGQFGIASSDPAVSVGVESLSPSSIGGSPDTRNSAVHSYLPRWLSSWYCTAVGYHRPEFHPSPNQQLMGSPPALVDQSSARGS
jgi:hypothetical protein